MNQKKSKIDLIFIAILVIFKFTIVPDLSWWLVFSPILISFGYGFIKGTIQGIKDRENE